MDKYEFIRRLENALSGLSDEEKSSALNYYKELFEDAGGDNAQELISNLGSPESIAENIIRESGTVIYSASESGSTAQSAPQSAAETGKKKGKRTALEIVLIIALLVVTFPLWIGFVIVGAAILFALLVVAFAVMLAIGIAGVVLFGTGITTIFSSFGIGTLLLGLGLLIIGICTVLLVPLCKGVFKLCSWIINGFVKLVRSIFCKREAVA